MKPSAAVAGRAARPLFRTLSERLFGRRSGCPLSASRPSRPLRRWSLVGLVTASAVLAGCGGGVYLTVPIGGYDEPPPSVALSPLPAVVQPGGVLTLGAATSSVYAIEDVAFYRIDGGRSTFLGADAFPPYQVTTGIPGDGRPSVAYFAQVRDVAGRVGESRVVAAPIVY